MKLTTVRKIFTGEDLAKVYLLHLTRKEVDEYYKKNKIKIKFYSNGRLAMAWRRIKPEKLFLIKFKEGHGIILAAEDENDACVQAVPFLAENQHSCKDPIYNSSCEKCKAVFNELAERLNNATVVWLGWVQPDCNWIIHV